MIASICIATAILSSRKGETILLSSSVPISKTSPTTEPAVPKGSIFRASSRFFAPISIYALPSSRAPSSKFIRPFIPFVNLICLPESVLGLSPPRAETLTKPFSSILCAITPIVSACAENITFLPQPLPMTAMRFPRVSKVIFSSGMYSDIISLTQQRSSFSFAEGDTNPLSFFIIFVNSIIIDRPFFANQKQFLSIALQNSNAASTSDSEAAEILEWRYLTGTERVQTFVPAAVLSMFPASLPPET